MKRRIVSFRKVGEHYRRIDEVHRVRLYDPHRSSLRTSSGPASGLGRCVLRGCLRRIDVDDQGLLRRSQNAKVAAETLLHSLPKADSGGLLQR
jgi:hypothetical protein